MPMMHMQVPRGAYHLVCRLSQMLVLLCPPRPAGRGGLSPMIKVSFRAVQRLRLQRVVRPNVPSVKAETPILPPSIPALPTLRFLFDVRKAVTVLETIIHSLISRPSISCKADIYVPFLLISQQLHLGECFLFLDCCSPCCPRFCRPFLWNPHRRIRHCGSRPILVWPRTRDFQTEQVLPPIPTPCHQSRSRPRL